MMHVLYWKKKKTITFSWHLSLFFFEIHLHVIIVLYNLTNFTINQKMFLSLYSFCSITLYDIVNSYNVNFVFSYNLILPQIYCKIKHSSSVGMYFWHLKNPNSSLSRLIIKWNIKSIQYERIKLKKNYNQKKKSSTIQIHNVIRRGIQRKE
jgi:hypothetical protein